MPSDEPRYWFPAKRYGWGWGLPSTWEGWAVISAYLVLFAAGWAILFSLFQPFQAMAGFGGYVLALSIALTAICWWKGEPPRWRWGGD